jgi:glycosyltransferase involved in cell wall biosynthesis
MKIGLIVPFFQAFGYLDRAIESVIAQTYTDWELILVSNNGDKESRDIAEKWVRLDSRVSLIEEPQQGIAYALNTGLLSCNRPLVARMDADDIALPHRLEKQVSFLQSHPDIGAVATQTDFSSAIGESQGYQLFVEWQNQIISPDDHRKNRFVESPLAHPSIMFRRELIDKHGWYSEDHVPEDYELWLRWMDKGVQIAKIPEKLLIWNDHAWRLSRTHSNYVEEAFDKVKCHYLAKWIKRTVPDSKKIVVCGTGKKSKQRAQLLSQYGINITGFTDVVQKNSKDFIPLGKIYHSSEYFLINFISKRGVGEEIRKYFLSIGFQEERDFILAG